MFLEEAGWIGRVLAAIDPTPNPVVGNLGSSTMQFRTEVQPHIDHHIFAPLLQRGFRVQHIDVKEADGVDVVADITAPDFGRSFRATFDVVLCTNLLEHVHDIQSVVRNVVECCMAGGYVLVTVPYRYRRHLDPIDNMFRPRPAEILGLFPPHASVIASAIIKIHDKRMYPLRRSRYPVWGRRERIAYWLGKRHQVSGILLRLH